MLKPINYLSCSIEECLVRNFVHRSSVNAETDRTHFDGELFQGNCSMRMWINIDSLSTECVKRWLKFDKKKKSYVHTVIHYRWLWFIEDIKEKRILFQYGWNWFNKEPHTRFDPWMINASARKISCYHTRFIVVVTAIIGFSFGGILYLATLRILSVAITLIVFEFQFVVQLNVACKEYQMNEFVHNNILIWFDIIGHLLLDHYSSFFFFYIVDVWFDCFDVYSAYVQLCRHDNSSIYLLNWLNMNLCKFC